MQSSRAVFSSLQTQHGYSPSQSVSYSARFVGGCCFCWWVQMGRTLGFSAGLGAGVEVLEEPGR